MDDLSFDELTFNEKIEQQRSSDSEPSSPPGELSPEENDGSANNTTAQEDPNSTKDEGKKKKAAKKGPTEKLDPENAVIISNWSCEKASIADLTALVEAECGKILVINERGSNKLYVKFDSPEAAEKASDKLPSMDPFGMRLSVEKLVAPAQPSDGKHHTLVLKNLPFSLKHDKLLEILNKMEVRPMYVRYHHDGQGVFRGIAFVKYKTVEDASRAFAIIEAAEIMGRKVRTEYKKKGTGSTIGSAPQASPSPATPAPSSAQPMSPTPVDGQLSMSPLPVRSPGFFIGSPDIQIHAALGSTPTLSTLASMGGGVFSTAHPGSLQAKQLFGSPSPSPAAASTIRLPSRGDDDSGDDEDVQEVERQLSAFVISDSNELAFSPSLTGAQRRIVHSIADKLGLIHSSHSEGEKRFIVVRKKSDLAPAHHRPVSTTLSPIQSSGIPIRNTPPSSSSKKDRSTDKDPKFPSFSGQSPKPMSSSFSERMQQMYSGSPNVRPRTRSDAETPPSAGKRGGLATSPSPVPTSSGRRDSFTYGSPLTRGGDIAATPPSRRMMGPTPSSSSKTPKGPDGTRGFAVGRGKPIVAEEKLV